MLLGITPTYCPEVLSYKRGQTLSTEIFKRILNRYQDPVLWAGRGLNFFPVLTTHSVQVSVVSVTFCFFLSFHLHADEQYTKIRDSESLQHVSGFYLGSTEQAHCKGASARFLLVLGCLFGLCSHQHHYLRCGVQLRNHVSNSFGGVSARKSHNW